MTRDSFGKNRKSVLWRAIVGLLMIAIWWDWNGLRPLALDRIVVQFGEGPVLFIWAFLICVLVYPLVEQLVE